MLSYKGVCEFSTVTQISAMIAKEREEKRKAKQTAAPQKKQQPLYQPQFQQQQQQQQTYSDGFDGFSSPKGRGGSQFPHRGRGRGGGSGGRGYSADRPHSGQQGNRYNTQ